MATDTAELRAFRARRPGARGLMHWGVRPPQPSIDSGRCCAFRFILEPEARRRQQRAVPSAWESDRSGSLTALTWVSDAPPMTAIDPVTPGLTGPPVARRVLTRASGCRCCEHHDVHLRGAVAVPRLADAVGRDSVG